MTQQFISKASAIAGEQREWHETSQLLQEEYRNLSQRKLAVEKEQREFEALVAGKAQLQTTAFSSDQLDQAATQWNDFLNFMEAPGTKAGMKMADRILEKQPNPHALDAKKPELRLDANVISYISNLLSSKGATSIQPYIDGKLDLANLVKLWADSLSSVVQPALNDLSNAVDMRDRRSESGDYLEDSIRGIRKLSEQHQNHAAAARKSAASVQQVLIPEMQENVSHMQSAVDDKVKAAISRLVAPPTPSSSVPLTPKKAWTQAEQEKRNRQRLLDLVPPTPAAGARAQPPTTASKRQPAELIAPETFSLLPPMFAASAVNTTLSPDQAVVSKMSSEIRAAVSTLSRSNKARASPASAAARKQKRISASAALAQATPSSKIASKGNLAAFGLSPLQVDTFDVEEIMKDLPAVAPVRPAQPRKVEVEKPANDSSLSAYISTTAKPPQAATVTVRAAPQKRGPGATSAKATAPAEKVVSTKNSKPAAPTTAAACSATANDAKKPGKRDAAGPKPWVLARQQRAADAEADKALEEKSRQIASKPQAKIDVSKPEQAPRPRKQAAPDVEKAFNFISQMETSTVELEVNYTMVDDLDATIAFGTRKQIARTPDSVPIRSSRTSFTEEEDLDELEQTVANITMAPADGDQDFDYNQMLDELDHDSVRAGPPGRQKGSNLTAVQMRPQGEVEEAAEVSINEEEDFLEQTVAQRHSKAVNAFSRAPASKGGDGGVSFDNNASLDPEMSMFEAELDRLDSPAQFRSISRSVIENELDASRSELDESVQSSIEMATAADIPINDSHLASPSSPSAGRFAATIQLPAVSDSPVSFVSKADDAKEESHRSVSLLDDSFVMPVGEEADSEEKPELPAFGEEEGDGLDAQDGIGESGSVQLDMSISIDEVAEQAKSNSLMSPDAFLTSPGVDLHRILEDSQDGLNSSLSTASPTLNRITKHLAFSPSI